MRGEAYGCQGAARTTDSDLDDSSQSDCLEDDDMPQLQTDEDDEEEDNIRAKYSKVGSLSSIYIGELLCFVCKPIILWENTELCQGNPFSFKAVQSVVSNL